MSDSGTPRVPAAFRSRRDARGRFILPWHTDEEPSRSLRDVLRWYRDRMFNPVPPNPSPDAFHIATANLALPRSTDDELRITWVGHATFLIQFAGINILTDPVWSQRASPVEWAGPQRLVPPGLDFNALPPIDVVILSHDHYDHLDLPTVRRLNERFGNAISWVTPLGYATWLRQAGIANVTELDWWDCAAVETEGGVLDIRATPAQHWSQRSAFSRGERLWASYILRAADHDRVYFGGDSGYFDGYRAIGRLGPFHAALLPIGAYEPRWFMKPAHMNPEEAVNAYDDLGAAGVFVGMHWGTFRLTDEDPLEPPVRTTSAWFERGHPPDRLWIPRHGETRIIPLNADRT